MVPDPLDNSRKLDEILTLIDPSGDIMDNGANVVSERGAFASPTPLRPSNDMTPP